MNLIFIEAERRNTLDRILQLLYGKVEPDEETLEQFPYPHVMLRHVQVTHATRSNVRFRDIHDAEKFGPIELPRPLWGLVREEDRYVVTLGLGKTSWELLYASRL